MNGRDECSDCSRIREKIEALLDQELPEDEVTRLQAHLRHCPACSSELELAGRIRDALHGLPDHPCPEAVSRTVFQKVRALYAGAAAALLIVGVLLGRTALSPGLPGDDSLRPKAGTSPVDRVSLDDLQITDLHIQGFDSATGKIRLLLDGVSSVSLDGNVQDQPIQDVLARAMTADLQPGTRMKAIDLLRRGTGSDRIREALIHALLHDRNPGVRMKAVEALKGLAQDKPVRQALITALDTDPNPGVRVEAIEGLKGFRDAATLRVLERRMQSDKNGYIRAEARRAVLAWREEYTGQL